MDDVRDGVGMEINIPLIQQYRTKYTDIWTAALQQDTSLLESYVTIMQSCRGKQVELPYLGKTELNERKGRLQKVEFTELSTGKRQMKPIQFEKFIGLSTDDPMFMDTLQLTSAQVIDEQRKAAARIRDAVILGLVLKNGKWTIRASGDGVVGGILAPNYTGNDGATLTPFDDTRTVVADFIMKGTKTPAGMILDKIVEGKRMMEESHAYHEGSGDMLCMAITPRQKAEIIMWEQQQNKNYGFSVLQHGKVNPMLGINFLVTDMLPVDASGNRICPMWLKSKVALGVWENPSFRIDQRDDYIDLLQVGVTCAYGATRKDEESFVKVLCTEPAEG